MKRLTFKAGGFNAFNDKNLSTYGGMQKDGSVIYIGDIANKLAEYEDLEEQGLLPKLPCKSRGSVKRGYMKRLTYRVNIGIPEDVILVDHKSTEECLEWKNVLERLAYYEDLEEQGLLLKLPCKVGDTLYRIDTDEKIKGAEVKHLTIENIVICGDGEVLFKFRFL